MLIVVTVPWVASPVALGVVGELQMRTCPVLNLHEILELKTKHNFPSLKTQYNLLISNLLQAIPNSEFLDCASVFKRRPTV